MLRKPRVWLLPASLAFLYFHLFIPPFTPIWTGGDAMIFLGDARRMLEGEVLYKDFVQLTFPGADLLYFTAFRLFGPRMWIPNVMLLFVGIALVWLSYRLAARIYLGTAALLPPLLFLTLVYRNRLDATHHWYSTLATMAALATAIDCRSPARVAACGVLCGLAASFTQSSGLLALLGFAAFLCWEHWKSSTTLRSLVQKELLLFGAFISVVALVCLPFAWQAGFARFVDCTLIFSLRYYGSLASGNSWRGYMTGLAGFLHWQRIPDLFGFLLVHALLPLAYVLFLIRYFRCSRRESNEPWDRLMLITFVGVASLLSVAAAPTWARLYYVSLPALLLLPWLLKSSGKVGLLASDVLCAATLILLATFLIAKQLHRPSYIDLPTGRTAFLNRDAYDRYSWAASQTRPGDFFFGGLYPDFYFLLDLKNPGPVAFVTPYQYTRPAEVEAVIAGLDAHQVKIVLWTPALDLPDTPQGDHLGPLRAYIRSHYHARRDFPDFQVWTRND
jgi:hypothetical protein